MTLSLPPAPSTAIDWDNLGFKWVDTNGHVKYIYSNGQWDQGEFVKDSYIKMHVCAPALNYGQEVQSLDPPNGSLFLSASPPSFLTLLSFIIS